MSLSKVIKNIYRVIVVNKTIKIIAIVNIEVYTRINQKRYEKKTTCKVKVRPTLLTSSA